MFMRFYKQDPYTIEKDAEHSSRNYVNSVFVKHNCNYITLLVNRRHQQGYMKTSVFLH